MKLKRLLFVAVGLMTIAFAHATSWRINPDPKAKAKFKTVAEAMEASDVVEGDTLLLDPGFYGDVSLTKNNITIIGPGFFLEQKEGWNEMDEVIFGFVGLSPYSTIEGCNASSLYSDSYSTVRRCKIDNINSSSSIYVVEQCFITGKGNIFDHAKIRNNIIFGPLNMSSFCNGAVIENNTIIIENEEPCIYFSTAWPSNCIVRNNILLNSAKEKGNVYTYRGNGMAIYNNVTNNRINQDYVNDKIIDASVETLFMNEGSNDGRWQLRADSPAKGAGANGEDCGAFGGSNHYVLAGVPRLIPHITKVEVPARPTNGKLTIKLKIENQDE